MFQTVEEGMLIMFRNLKHMIVLKFLLPSIFVVIAFPSVSFGNNLSHAHTLAAILSTERCSSPCLFDMSLKDATYEQIKSLLETSPFTSDAQIKFEDKRISWYWSHTVEQWFTSSTYPNLGPWHDLNYINFKNGLVWDVNIAFALPLKDIIDVFGDDFRTYPFGSDGRWNVYGLAYQEPSGIFTTSKNCDSPDFPPDTLIENYYYRSTFIPTLDDPETTILWQGYSTELQNCSFFKPG